MHIPVITFLTFLAPEQFTNHVAMVIPTNLSTTLPYVSIRTDKSYGNELPTKHQLDNRFKNLQNGSEQNRYSSHSNGDEENKDLMAANTKKPIEVSEQSVVESEASENADDTTVDGEDYVEIEPTTDRTGTTTQVKNSEYVNEDDDIDISELVSSGIKTAVVEVSSYISSATKNRKDTKPSEIDFNIKEADMRDRPEEDSLDEQTQEDGAPINIPPLGKPSMNLVISTQTSSLTPTTSNIDDSKIEIDFTDQDCPKYNSIGTQVSEQNSKCILYSDHVDTCNTALNYYQKDIKIAYCKGKIHPQICRFENSTRTDVISSLHLICDNNICQDNAITIGIMNPKTGKIDHVNIENITAVKEALKGDTQTNLNDHSADFIFLSCKKRNSKAKLHQLLQFPPVVMTSKSTESKIPKDILNINIFVIDSLSRQHFYRILPNTVKAMKTINTDHNRETQILDFKTFQSLAPFTYVNLQAFLTGTVNFDSIENRRYNFEKLFTIFKKAGYQTLLQEDTCWYDEWGSILTGNRKLKTKSNTDHNLIWREISNITDIYSVDSFGLTHMSCEVLSKYGATNLYNNKNMVCLNGKPISSYFIDYLLETISLRDITPNAKPLLSYTHINFAHESTGVRIKSLDSYLEKFIFDLGRSKNTLTILWSDHGGKTNKYSIDTLAGRFEVYDPFLFMIVPNKLKSIVGQENFKALVSNQNSLTNVIDLRNTLIDIVERSVNARTGTEGEEEEENKEEKENLMSSQIRERTNCQSMPSRKYSLCKCLNYIDFPDMKDPKTKEFLIWLGEFAIGYLNNLLTNQKGLSNHVTRCLRLVGNKIKNVIRRKVDENFIYIFDVLVPSTSKHFEIFNFHVLFNNKRNETMEMLTMNHWLRISLYNLFVKCKDKNVSIELCICSKNHVSRVTEKSLKRTKQFGEYGIIHTISNWTCLLLIKRSHVNVITFEIANLCDVYVDFSFQTPILFSWEVSESLPLTRRIHPSQLLFLSSFLKVVESDETVLPQVKIISST